MTSDRSRPRLNARVIFIDIDDTITTSTGISTGDSILGTLVAVVAQANNLDAKAARAKIDAVMDVETRRWTATMGRWESRRTSSGWP